MRSSSSRPSPGASLRAFQQITSAPTDGLATRSRVLATSARHLRRQQALHRVLGLLLPVLIFLSLSTAAWTAALHWHAPATITISASAPGASSASFKPGDDRPFRIIPPLLPEASAPYGDPWSAESQTYRRAHEAHFGGDDPARALIAWDLYLQHYPQGLFAPEARFNRALCLARIGRYAEAAHALTPFAAHRPATYHHAEACTLLTWLSDRSSVAPAARTACE
jgi:hypothetical protein